MEIKEELGIDATLSFIEKSIVHDTNESHFTYWFIGKYTDGEIKLEKEEVEGYAWVNKDELDNLIQSGSPYIPGLVQWANRYWNGEFDNLIK